MRKIQRLCSIGLWTICMFLYCIEAFMLQGQSWRIYRKLSSFDTSRKWPTQQRQTTTTLAVVGDKSESQSLLDDIKLMRVKEIKTELDRLGISTAGMFEKDELVKCLVDARQKNEVQKQQSSNSTKRMDEVKDSTEVASPSKNENVIVSPLYFTMTDAGRKAAGVEIRAGDKPYATIQINARLTDSSETVPLNVLMDTACSGFVLRPSTVERYKLPKLSTPVTMTGAGGSVGATGLTQIDKFSIPTMDGSDHPKMFGPMPAAVQDIGGLPQALDGIIGLSFLNQFTCVEMDFAAGTVSFDMGNKLLDESLPNLVGRADMEYISSLGLFTVQVYLGDRGPVSMLVDSGASNTFLNWKGIDDLGVRRDDKLLQRQYMYGAVGSDNVAMELTHRVTVGSSLKIGSKANCFEPGISLSEDARNLRIDIGNIAILDQLQRDNVGGILGIDALMRCSRVRFQFGNGPGKPKQLELFE